MVDFVSKPDYDINDLKQLINLLCSPDGCPWDREQTHESIRRNMLEEAYEAADAVRQGNINDLIEELGDVLMQVVFHANIAQRSGEFTFDDITTATCKKLIRRHPHVFGDIKANNGEESLSVWDDIKRKEKQHKSTSDAMKSTARDLPALWRAEKIQSKAAKIGFDWPDYTGALNSLHKEIKELEEAINNLKANPDDPDAKNAVTEELGDILFSTVNTARFFKTDPEEALGLTTDKFISRFICLEQKAAEQNKNFKDMSLDEMEELYQSVKLEK